MKVSCDVLLLNAFLGSALRACSASQEALRAPAGSGARVRALATRNGAAAEAEQLLAEAADSGVIDVSTVRKMAGQVVEMLVAQRAAWTRLDALTRTMVASWPSELVSKAPR